MKTIWKGKLTTTQGRNPEEFDAEIVQDCNGELVLFKCLGLVRVQISPHEVDGESWMKALVELRGSHKC